MEIKFNWLGAINSFKDLPVEARENDACALVTESRLRNENVVAIFENSKWNEVVMAEESVEASIIRLNNDVEHLKRQIIILQQTKNVK